MSLYYIIVDHISSNDTNMEMRLQKMEELADLTEAEAQDASAIQEDIDDITQEVTERLYKVTSVFNVINYVCYANMLYIVQMGMSFIFLKKMGRNFDFPTVTQALDIIQFISSLILIQWVTSNLDQGKRVTSEESQA